MALRGRPTPIIDVNGTGLIINPDGSLNATVIVADVALGLTDMQLRATPVDVDPGVVAVTGPLTDAALRATAVPVSGTFYQGTQPVSGTFFQATQPVSLAAAPTTATRNASDRNIYDYTDRTDNRPVYVGTNDQSAVVAATTWVVRKFFYDGSDRVVDVQLAVNIAWSGRTGHAWRSAGGD